MCVSVDQTYSPPDSLFVTRPCAPCMLCERWERQRGATAWHRLHSVHTHSADVERGCALQVPKLWSSRHAQAVSAWSAGYILYFMLYGSAPPQVAGQTDTWRPSHFMEAMHSNGCADTADSWLPRSACLVPLSDQHVCLTLSDQ